MPLQVCGLNLNMFEDHRGLDKVGFFVSAKLEVESRSCGLGANDLYAYVLPA